VGDPLPDRAGLSWHSSTSADSSYEIFIRADLSEPEEVLAVLIKEPVHTLLPTDAGHGKLFKTAATRIGLDRERPSHGRTREAAHDQLYDRTADIITLDELERIVI
jgi:hypothetical protein